ncbi:MAG: PAS domain-containing sensor histidine kinase [Candidatus Cloacimonadaceae bacterium]|nr:PAS domain-containing sensor histidine kinase [Candidatus Cloacimonadaceae bacterium]
MTAFAVFILLQIMTESEKNNRLDDFTKDGVESFNTLIPELMSNLLCNLPGIAYRCRNDSKWTMLFLSEGCGALTGYQPLEILYNSELSYEDLILQEDRILVRESVNLSVENRIQFMMEYRIRCKDGAIKWVLEKGNAIYDANRNPVYLDGFITDITNMKLLETQLRDKAAELSELNMMKDKFFSIIVHDLQNPVYAIISLGDFIHQNYSKFSPCEMEDFIRQISGSAKNMYLLLENLLDWTRAQNGQVKVQTSLFNLSQNIRDCIDDNEVHALQKEIVFEIDIDPEIRLYSDQRLMTTVLRNLISNAVKYSQPGGKVVIRAERIMGELIISVQDYGIGIPRVEIPGIFRIDSSYRRPGTKQEPGTGLGLILVEDFVKRLGGELNLQSRINRGSTFSVVFKGQESDLGITDQEYGLY